MQDECSPSTGPTCDDGTTLEPSRPMEIGAPMLSAADSLARTSATLANEQASPEGGADCGASSRGSLAWYDRDSLSWRTSQRCLDGEWELYSAAFPRSGLMQSGMLYRQPQLVRRISGKGSGLRPTPVDMSQGGSVSRGGKRKGELLLAGMVKRFPTPSTSGFECKDVERMLERRKECKEGAGNGNGFGLTLGQYVAMFPTPVSRDARSFMGAQHMASWTGSQSLAETIANMEQTRNGALNPTWVEWLMGFPLEWTALDASVTPSCRKSPNGSENESYNP